MLGSCWPLGRFLGHFFSFLGTSVFEVAFGSDFFRFRIEFGRILARFGKDFWKIFRRIWAYKQWLGRPRESQWMDGWMDGWTDGWMDGWRSTNHWNDGWMVRRGPQMLDFRVGRGSGRWFPGALFLKLFFESVFFEFLRFLVDFGRFSEAKMEAKIDFWEDFSNVFFERVLASILGRFLEARNLKNQ